MKVEKETDDGVFSLSFSSKIVDVEMKKLLIINQMFEDNKFTETKLKRFK